MHQHFPRVENFARNGAVVNIHVITPNYPHPLMPEQGAFVQRLVHDWKESGEVVRVIRPLPLGFYFQRLSAIRRQTPQISGLPRCDAKPIYWKLRGNSKSFARAALTASRKLGTPQIYYGKFLESGGAAAAALGLRSGKPAFADVGESKSFRSLSGRNLRQVRDITKTLTGAVCVSERLLDELLWLGCQRHRILYLPNKAEKSSFYHINQEKARRAIGYGSRREKIVCFVGHLNNRKGALRLKAALDRLSDDVVGVWLGQGPEIPRGANVLHVGSVPHNEIVLWLNACDVFVLPTLAEGWCNALEEARACGLPIVTSDITDVRAQMEGEPTIFVDPNDVSDIANGITKALEIPKNMQLGSHNLSANNSTRGSQILKWMRDVIKQGPAS